MEKDCTPFDLAEWCLHPDNDQQCVCTARLTKNMVFPKIAATWLHFTNGQSEGQELTSKNTSARLRARWHSRAGAWEGGLVTCACRAQKGGPPSHCLVYLPCRPKVPPPSPPPPAPDCHFPPPVFCRHPLRLRGPLRRRQTPVVPLVVLVCGVWTRPADEGGHTPAPFFVQPHRLGRSTRAFMGLFKKKAAPPPPPRPSGPPPPSMEGTWQLVVTGAAAVGVGWFLRQCAA